MTELRNELTFEEVPQDLVVELHEAFGNVIFELGSDINEDTRSLKLNYTHQINDELITETTVMNPETFKPNMVPCNGYANQTYIIRADAADDGVIVRRILESGVIIKEAETP